MSKSHRVTVQVLAATTATFKRNGTRCFVGTLGGGGEGRKGVKRRSGRFREGWGLAAVNRILNDWIVKWHRLLQFLSFLSFRWRFISFCYLVPSFSSFSSTSFFSYYFLCFAFLSSFLPSRLNINAPDTQKPWGQVGNVDNVVNQDQGLSEREREIKSFKKIIGRLF